MLCFNYGITMNLSQTGCNDEVLVAKNNNNNNNSNNNNNNNNPRFVFIFLQTMRSMRDYMVTDIFDGWGILLPCLKLTVLSCFSWLETFHFGCTSGCNWRYI